LREKNMDQLSSCIEELSAAIPRRDTIGSFYPHTFRHTFVGRGLTAASRKDSVILHGEIVI
jgi:hypothetical protein